MNQYAIYTRTHSAGAWRYERQTNKEAAELEVETNKGYGTDTLIVPFRPGIPLPVFLDSYQTQSDFEL